VFASIGTALTLLLAITLIEAQAGAGEAGRTSQWRSATAAELHSVIPARAPVISERIETEFRTASAITDGKGKFVAGVVLITAGYSAEGKYSHFFLTQVPLHVGNLKLSPGQYLIGWTHHNDDSLLVSFYRASTGDPVGQIVAPLNESIHRIESFRVWPPDLRPVIQIGRFTFSYSLDGN
jgi:hypothetical protein